MRPLWFGLGLASVGIGLAGVVLPLVPTTPMMILAAACFAKSSPRLHDWLWDHPLFGPAIRDWRQYGAIPRKAKIASIVAMAAAFGLSLYLGLKPWVLAAQGSVLFIMGSWIISRPSGPSDENDL